MIKKILTTSIAIIIVGIAHSQSNQIPSAVGDLIKEAHVISDILNGKIWQVPDDIPFTILLVTEEHEFLAFHPYPSEDFKESYFDSILNTEVYFRKRTLAKDFLATWPAVNGVFCIVAGTPANTNKSSSEWIVSLLHEHFHQFQMSESSYQASVKLLELDKGDESGMWMINFPFPYEDSAIVKLYSDLAKNLITAVEATEEDFEVAYANLKIARKAFKEALSKDDYNYFSFQIWQEGIARYTEYKFLELLDGYQPTESVSFLTDWIPFTQLKTKLYQNEKSILVNSPLNETKRIQFYAFGMMEGLLLDRVSENWQNKYFGEKFFLDRYY